MNRPRHPHQPRSAQSERIWNGHHFSQLFSLSRPYQPMVACSVCQRGRSGFSDKIPQYERKSMSCRVKWCGNLIWKTLAYPCCQLLPRLPNEILDRRLHCLCLGDPNSWRARVVPFPLSQSGLIVPVGTVRTDHKPTSHGMSCILLQQGTSQFFPPSGMCLPNEAVAGNNFQGHVSCANTSNKDQSIFAAS